MCKQNTGGGDIVHKFAHRGWWWWSGGTICKIFRKGDRYNNLQKQETRKVIYHDNLQKRQKERWAVTTICKKRQRDKYKPKIKHLTFQCANKYRDKVRRGKHARVQRVKEAAPILDFPCSWANPPLVEGKIKIEGWSKTKLAENKYTQSNTARSEHFHFEKKSKTDMTLAKSNTSVPST